MKKTILLLCFAVLCGFICTTPALAQVSTNPPLLITHVGSDDVTVTSFTPQFIGDATHITVGVEYTKGASGDSLSVVEVYRALSPGVLNASKGVKLSTDATLRFANSSAHEYKEQTITLDKGAAFYIIKLNMSASATDTVTSKIWYQLTRPAK